MQVSRQCRRALDACGVGSSSVTAASALRGMCVALGGLPVLQASACMCLQFTPTPGLLLACCMRVCGGEPTSNHTHSLQGITTHTHTHTQLRMLTLCVPVSALFHLLLCATHCTTAARAVTVVDSGAQALDLLSRSAPGTFQLILTVSPLVRRRQWGGWGGWQQGKECSSRNKVATVWVWRTRQHVRHEQSGRQNRVCVVKCRWCHLVC